MPDAIKKRRAQDAQSRSKRVKRIRHELSIGLLTQSNTTEDDGMQIRSPSPHSIAAQYGRELLEMLDRVQHQVEVLQDEISLTKEDRERTCIKYEEELERYRDRIDTLEEQATYQKAVMEVTEEEVDMLEGETEHIRRKLREVVECVHGDVTGKTISIEGLKSRIIAIVDHAYL
ncbi:hypothetical protein C8R48DRAFT_782933 [Suillus tomentosus]|nr:hypothetical protein C8R48DRAFT_782933 [Suillus tomentosus]